MPNSELDELRQRVRDLERKSKQKINRNARKGVKLQGTKYDPIRPDAPVSNYTRVQLETYSRRLERFNMRANQFVPGRRGTPLPIQQWRTYKREERASNAAVQKHLDAVSQIYVPAIGMTIGQRMAATQSEFPQTANPAANQIYQKVNRNSNGIVDEKALAKLVREQKNKITPRLIKSKLFIARGEFADMMTMAGAHGISDKANKLSDHQFNFLWYFTNTPGAASIAYEILMSKLAGRNARWYDSVADDQMSDIDEMVDWVAKNVPADSPMPKPTRRKKNYSDTNAGPIKLWTDTKAGSIELS